MTDKEFYHLVKRMRQAQKDYFRGHDNKVLLLSKDLERRVDRFIARQEWANRDRGQGLLFKTEDDA